MCGCHVGGCACVPKASTEISAPMCERMPTFFRAGIKTRRAVEAVSIEDGQSVEIEVGGLLGHGLGQRSTLEEGETRSGRGTRRSGQSYRPVSDQSAVRWLWVRRRSSGGSAMAASHSGDVPGEGVPPASAGVPGAGSRGDVEACSAPEEPQRRVVMEDDPDGRGGAKTLQGAACGLHAFRSSMQEYAGGTGRR